MANTNVDEFRLFHQLLTASRPDYMPFYFILRPGGKEPLGERGSWKEAGVTFEEACDWMKAGYNLGIAGTDHDPLVIIDIDKEGVVDDIKPTLCVRTRKRTGRHFFYFTSDPRCKINVPSAEHVGELRALWQYVVVAGSYVSTDSKKLETPPPEDQLPSLGSYTIEKDLPVATITFDELPLVFRKTLADQGTQPQAKREPKKWDREGPQSKLWAVTIENVIGEHPATNFPSPFHGSEGGTNTTVSNGLLHCWRHNVSLTPLQALVVKAGILDCMAAGDGHAGSAVGPSVIDFKDKEFVLRIWDYAKKNKIVPENDLHPFGDDQSKKKRGGKGDKKQGCHRKDYPHMADDVWKGAVADANPDEITILARPYYYFKNGSIAKELVGTDGIPRYAVYDAPTKTISVVSHIVGDLGETIIPLWDKAIGPKLGLALPSEPVEYGDATALYNDILAFALKYYDPVDAEGLSHLKICILYVFLTGFQDKNITYWPIVNMRGQSEAGKGRLAKIMYLLADRGMWQVAPKLGSLHRAVNDWKPTLCLDEADLKDSSEAADLIQFYNSRATGAIIWRYSTDAQTNQISEVTGPTIMCTRKPFLDDGIESRCLVVQAKPGRNLGQKGGVPYLEPPEMFTTALELRNKLLTFWLRNLTTYTIDYYGSVKGPVTARLQGTALELMGMAEKIGLEKVVTDTLTEISTHVVEQRSESPLGKIIQTIHMLWTDSMRGAPTKSKSDKYPNTDGYYGLIGYLDSEIADQAIVDIGPGEVGMAGHKPFGLTNRNDPNKPMSGISIGKYLKQTGIKIDQVRVSPTVSKKVLCIKPDDIEHLCRKYVPEYVPGTVLASTSTLENFAEPTLETASAQVGSVSGVSFVSDRQGSLPPKIGEAENFGAVLPRTSADSVPVEKKLECVSLTETPETPISQSAVVPPYVRETGETPETKKSIEPPSTVAEEKPKTARTKVPTAEERAAMIKAVETINDNGSNEVSEWCIFKLKERKLDGAKNYSAYHLRQDARAQFPDQSESVEQLIDLHFMEMNAVAEFTAKYGNPKNLGG